MWKKDEKRNKQKLLALVDEMAALDKVYPELGTPSKVRKMQELGCFDIGKRPWDCLIAIGYSMLSLGDEEDKESNIAIYRLQKKVQKALKYPMAWMYDALDYKAQSRYLTVAGRTMPRAAILKRRIPSNLTRENIIFNRSQYESLIYVLERFCNSMRMVDMLTEDTECFGIISVREMRDLVASMEVPPQSILDELTQRAVEIELGALLEDLLQTQRKVSELKRLQYTAPADSAELAILEEIVCALGVEVKFTDCDS